MHSYTYKAARGLTTAFHAGGEHGNYSETSTPDPLQSTTQQIPRDHSTIIRWVGFAIGAVIVLVVVLIISITLYWYRWKRIR
jgi:fatty acid desaturase